VNAPFVTTWRCNKCGTEHRGTIEEHAAERWLDCGPISRDPCDGHCGKKTEGWDTRLEGGFVHMPHARIGICRSCVLEAEAVQPLRERYEAARGALDEVHTVAAQIRGGELLAPTLDESLAQIEDLCVLFDGDACRLCGCTQEMACEGGCWWVEADLCSECATPAQKAAAPGWTVSP
jgi:hypothetical protein